MIITLQKYIFRELIKVCCLTIVALTIMMCFGGGLLDMLQSKGITARELLKLLSYLMPGMLAYSLPVAALFATTITYGRLSASNEIDACRAGGINIHKLLIPAIVLSLLVFVASFVLTNYAIPSLTAKAFSLIKRNLQTLTYIELKKQGYVAQMNFAVHAGRVDHVLLAQPGDNKTSQSGAIHLSQVAFLQHKQGIPVRYGTADTALIQFNHSSAGSEIMLHLNQLRAFNEERNEMIQESFQTIGPLKMPSFVKRKIKFLSLSELSAVLSDPKQFPDVRQAMFDMRQDLRKSIAYQTIATQMLETGRCELPAGKYRYVITSENIRSNRMTDGRIILQGKVKIVQHRPDGYRTFLTNRAMIKTMDASPNQAASLMISMKNVKVADSADIDPDSYTDHANYILRNIPPLQQAVKQARQITDQQLLDPEFSLDLNQQLTDRRFAAHKLWNSTLLRTGAEYHSRLA